MEGDGGLNPFNAARQALTAVLELLMLYLGQSATVQRMAALHAPTLDALYALLWADYTRPLALGMVRYCMLWRCMCEWGQAVRGGMGEEGGLDTCILDVS